MPQRAKLSKWKADPEAAMQRLFDNLPNGPELGRVERVSPMMGVVEYPNDSEDIHTRFSANWRRGPFRRSVVGRRLCGWAFQSAEWLAEPSTGPGKLQALWIVALRLTAGGTDVTLLAMNFSSQISRPAAHTIRSSG